jgi:ankyrin repeat protein
MRLLWALFANMFMIGRKRSKHFELFLEALNLKDLALAENAIENGFVVNEIDKNKWTPLLYACDKQNIELVKFLVNHGADVSYKDTQGYDAIDISYYAGEYRMGAYTEKSKELVKFLKEQFSG